MALQSARSVAVRDNDSSINTSPPLQTLFPSTSWKVTAEMLLLLGVFAIDKSKTRKKLAKRGCDRISLDALLMLAGVVIMLAGDGRKYFFPMRLIICKGVGQERTTKVRTNHRCDRKMVIASIALHTNQ